MVMPTHHGGMQTLRVVFNEEHSTLNLNLN